MFTGLTVERKSALFIVATDPRADRPKETVSTQIRTYIYIYISDEISSRGYFGSRVQYLHQRETWKLSFVRSRILIYGAGVVRHAYRDAKTWLIFRVALSIILRSKNALVVANSDAFASSSPGYLLGYMRETTTRDDARHFTTGYNTRELHVTCVVRTKSPSSTLYGQKKTSIMNATSW